MALLRDCGSHARVRRYVGQKVVAVKLRTDFIYPPIPDRRWDWQVISDDYEPYSHSEHGIVGSGPTEFDAIVDWLIQWEPQE